MVNIFAGGRRLAVGAIVAVACFGVYTASQFHPEVIHTERMYAIDGECVPGAVHDTKIVYTPGGATAFLHVCYFPGVRDVHGATVARMAAFADTVNLAALDRRADAQVWYHRRMVALRLLPYVLGIALGTFVIGWIVRGFLGIPRGMDRPMPPASSPDPTP